MREADYKDPAYQRAHAEEAQRMIATTSQMGGVGGLLGALALAKGGKIDGKVDFNPLLKSFEDGEVAKMNSIARQIRNHDIRKGRMRDFPSWATGLAEANRAAVKKASAAVEVRKGSGALDVGGLTDFSQVTGGQALGLMSMDTKLARGTVRPRSFTLWNTINKSMAGQIVDFYGYVSAVGGGLPGTAFQSFSNQTQGTIAINSGSYQDKFLRLKLAVDGRAITMALASSNNFVNVADQENANAAINILSTLDWSLYWGNPTLYPNQQAGIASYIPAKNKIDFWGYYSSPAVQALGISPQQALFNLLYEHAGFISNLRQNGQTTHAFMAPTLLGDLQSLVTTNLRNIANDLTDTQRASRGITVNGDLVGMNSRFGDIAFPVDMFIAARDVAAQAILDESTGAPASMATTVLSGPATVAVAAVSGVSGSDFVGSFGGISVAYAAATADANMNESVLTWAGAPVTVPTGGAVNVTVTPGAVGVPAAFRIFRSGAGYAPAGANPAAVRWIADVAANGATPVVFQDLNQHIPGSDTVFMLDLDDQDDALDYRMMLPLTKIELFAQNLFMPWAVAHIGAVRLKVPKWHGMITNYPSLSPQFNALQPNTNATIS